MGLDSVELLIAFEDEFGISIDDADAARLTTPQEAADYVAYRLGAANGRPKRCLSQTGFHRLRAILVRQFGAKRGDVRPDSRIKDFLTGNTRTQWGELKAALDATQLPGLTCGQPMLGLLSAGIPLLCCAFVLWIGGSFWSLIPVAMVSWVATMVVAHKLGTEVPAAVATIGALVPYVGHIQHEQWTCDEILQRVIQTTSNQVGIPVDRIKPDHHFVKDLGLD